MISKPVDTAIQMVVGPLIDETDMKTREMAIAYDATGMDLDLIVEKTDGSVTKTDITLTTGGDNDWNHLGNGYYRVEITAAQNAEEGVAYLAGYADGVLPFRSAAYAVVPGQVYNSLVGGSDLLQVDAAQLSGDGTAADNAESFFDGTGYAGTNNTIPAVTAVGSVTTKTGYELAASQHVIVDSGTVTTLTNAPADSAGVSEILTRLPDATAGQAGGLFIAGSNATTTVNFTGNLSGSVGSVAAAVTVTGKPAVTLAAADVSGNLPADIKAIDGGTNKATLLAAYCYNQYGIALKSTDIDTIRNGLASNASVIQIGLDVQDAYAVLSQFIFSEAGDVKATLDGEQVVLSPVGLDQIPVTPAAGVPATFRQMLVGVYRRLFRKADLLKTGATTGTLRQYADNGVDILTSQAVSDDGTTQTIGSAS